MTVLLAILLAKEEGVLGYRVAIFKGDKTVLQNIDRTNKSKNFMPPRSFTLHS